MQTALLRIPAAAAILCSATMAFEDSDAVLRRFLERIRTDLDRLPNLVCSSMSTGSAAARRISLGASWTRSDWR